MEDRQLKKLFSEMDNMEEDQLFSALGVASGRVVLGAAPPGDPIERGKAWFAEQLPEWKKKICESNRVQDVFRDPSADNLQERLAIAEVLSAILSGLPLAVVTYLISRKQLTVLCREYWV